MHSLRVLLAVTSGAAIISAAEVPVVDLATGAECACTQLGSSYGNKLLDENSANYTAEATDHWDKRGNLSPKCIYLPETADEVADALSIIYNCGAQFAIRGGGHMNYPGSNSIDGGVLVALSALNTVTVADDKKSLDAGPGARWVDVYTALAPHGLYCIGGRLKTIGVPGLTLIGGFHYLINKYGYVMDNVLNYDIVLGNGTQVKANASSNPDLFWALKGGGSNFGIVTKFTLKAFDIPKVSTTIQAFNETDAHAFLKASVDYVKNQRPDIASGAVISVSHNLTTDIMSPSILGVQEGTESPPSEFAPYDAITPVTKIDRVLDPIDWHSTLESPNQIFRIQFAHKTMKPDADQLIIIYDAWKAAVQDIRDVKGLYATFVLNTMPANAAVVSEQNGGNTWGLPTDQSYIIWQLATSWDDASDDLRMNNWALAFTEYWHSETKAKGLASDFIYMGDAGEFQDAFAGMPLENVRRLKEIQKAYDPEAVFSRLNWGGFKLGAN